MRAFHQVLANSLAASVVNTFVWFAVTFWVFLETRSVVATSVMAGIYAATVALSGFLLGSIVDHFPRKTAMLISSGASLALYGAAAALLGITPHEAFGDVSQPALWALIVLTLVGAIAGNLRGITLSTLVTVYVPPSERDRANGLVGTANGVAFLIASIFSGLGVGYLGMPAIIGLSIAATVAVVAHLATLHIPDTPDHPDVDDGLPGERAGRRDDIRDAHEVAAIPLHPGLVVPAVVPEGARGGASDAEEAPAGLEVAGAGQGLDLAGTVRVVRGVPGLFGLIFFQTFNNFLGGIFMALMDAYGLLLMSVQRWGLVWGALSMTFIVSGIVVARRGLGSRPLRALFLANVAMWAACIVFPARPSIALLVLGMFVWLSLVPIVEAAEQTILQQVVPLARQGRVFGFAQSVEQAASPITAFLVGPIAELAFIPYMTTGAGAALLGPWLGGTGTDRGLALLFIVAGVVGLLITLAAMRSRSYHLLAARYAGGATGGG